LIGLQAALRSTSLALSAELAPIPDAEALLARARRLSGSVDAIQVTENPGLRPLGSPLLAASLLRQGGMEPVLHVSCRNRNRVALQSELLGAATAGVSALLLRRNVPMRVGRAVRRHAVFDIGARELIGMARKIRDAEPPSSYGLARPPEFFIGATATVFDATVGWEPKSLLAKLDSGVQWLQTQLCMDLPLLRSYMRRFVTAHLTHRAHVVVTVAPLLSVESARRLRANVRGARIPKAVVLRLEQARDPEQTGVEICAEMLRALAVLPGVAGAHIIAPGDPDLVRAVIDASGLRKPGAPPGNSAQSQFTEPAS
jgi:methylenetetrahydrofolate reductase (NADH)